MFRRRTVTNEEKTKIWGADLIINSIFRELAMAAASTSLDSAGASLLSGAWPTFEAAIRPVISRLESAGGGGPLFASDEIAAGAAERFEQDEHLQGMASNLLTEQLRQAMGRTGGMSNDELRLAALVTLDELQLGQVFGDTADISRCLTADVRLDEQKKRIEQKLKRDVASCRRVKTIAERELGGLTEQLVARVNRLHERAKALFHGDQPENAAFELENCVFELAHVLYEAPTDTKLQMLLAMIFKTSAEVYTTLERFEDADRYMARAGELFLHVHETHPSDEVHALDMANALHDLGSLQQERGRFPSAIENFKLATLLYPEHCYAWHDMFLSYLALARMGNVNLQAMRHALEMTKSTGADQPGLEKTRLDRLDEVCQNIEKTL